MPRPGIKVLEDSPGNGPPIQKGDWVRLLYSIALNRGDILFEDIESIWRVEDRNFVAGFRYGLEGMRVGGMRKFKASPHLCYRDQEIAGIPKDAVLVFTVKTIELVSENSTNESLTSQST